MANNEDCSKMTDMSLLDKIEFPLISVITICYNELPDTIHFTFSSIASQTYPYIEWIVVDGGSSDATISVINEYSAKITTLISEPDNGIYDAMNKGIKNAHGDFLLFMNVRDRFAEHSTLSDVTKFIEQNPGYDCYYGDALFFDPKQGTSYLNRQEKNAGRFQLYFGTISHQATLSSKSLYDRIGAFDTSYRIIADREWIIRSIVNGAKWKHTGITVCNYEIGGVSSNAANRKNETKRMLNKYYKLPEKLIYPIALIIQKIWRKPFKIWRSITEDKA